MGSITLTIQRHRTRHSSSRKVGRYSNIQRRKILGVGGVFKDLATIDQAEQLTLDHLHGKPHPNKNVFPHKSKMPNYRPQAFEY